MSIENIPVIKELELFAATLPADKRVEIYSFASRFYQEGKRIEGLVDVEAVGAERKDQAYQAYFNQKIAEARREVQDLHKKQDKFP